MSTQTLQPSTGRERKKITVHSSGERARPDIEVSGMRLASEVAPPGRKFEYNQY